MTFTSGRFEASDKWQSVNIPDINTSAKPVIITSITTSHGGNTAGIRLRNVQSDTLEAFIEEETSKDEETSHVSEVVRYVGTSSGSIRDVSNSLIGEAGVVELDQPDREHWHTISLAESYNDPVVFVQIMSYRGPHECHSRVRNVQSDSFEFQIEEWAVHDGVHTKEIIGYLVLEQGTHDLDDGFPIEVAKISANHTWTNVKFGNNFGSEPAVVSRCQTQNGGQEVVTRHRNLDAHGIDVRLQGEEARDGNHTQEIISVLAMPRRDVSIGIGRIEDITHLWTEFEFESYIDKNPVVLTAIETWNGKDTVSTRLRNVSATNAEIFIEEETSDNEETQHNPETISTITLSSGKHWNKTGDFIGEAGIIRTNQPGRDTWHSLKFSEQYDDPVVFMQMMTYNGENPSHIRLRNIHADNCEFQIEEWDYLDGEHFEETIGYFVVESGTHELKDGSHLHVGTTQSSHEWGSEINFTPDYKNKQPVVITQCQTLNGADPVVTRIRNLDAYGFEVRLQEEESKGNHTIETVGFISIARPGRSVPEYQTNDVPDVVVDDFDPTACGFHFSNSFPSGKYTLPNPINIGPVTIDEVGDTSNGMCGGMVYAARDYYEYGLSPWSQDFIDTRQANSPISMHVPAEDTKLFDFLSERLFDSFKPGSGNILGAVLYQTLMNSANTKKFGQIKKSRNQVMKEHWQKTIKPSLDNGNPCPLGLIHVDTHGKPFETGLNKLGENHQVLAYGYSKRGKLIEIHVYDPNYPRDPHKRIQFVLKNDLGNWFEPTYIGVHTPLYAFFAPAYSPKKPPVFEPELVG